MGSEPAPVTLMEADGWQVRDLRLSLRQLKANFDEVVRERDEAREVSRDALEVVRVLARTFAAAELTEIKRRDPRGLDGWGVHEYGNFVLTTISAMRQRLIAENRELKGHLEEATRDSAGTSVSELQAMEAQLAECREERDRATGASQEGVTRKAQLEARLEAARAREAKLGQDLAAAHERIQELFVKTGRPASAGKGVMETGGQALSREGATLDHELGEHELQLLSVLALDGRCRRPEIEAKLKREHGVPLGGTMARLFSRLEEGGLIEQARPKSEIGSGPPPTLVWLRRKGAHVCREVLGTEPVEQEGARLRSRHKSTEHAFLNLVAGDILRDAGYDVDLFPDPIQVDGHLVDPDIVATTDGRAIIVECERYTRKDRDHRARKWNGLAQATELLSGSKDLYVLTPNKEAKNAIISELSQWRGEWRETSKGTEVHVSSAHEVLVQGKGLWTYERRF